ncbi:MAG TPA: HypC/HybG/HupF family hydrogenase formation chaperone [Solirubrobacteraceae bacterium]
MSCDPHDVCITCSDQAVPMIVRALDATGLATCVDADGRSSEVDVTLVDAAVGQTVLVHAGAAIA